VKIEREKKTLVEMSRNQVHSDEYADSRAGQNYNNARFPVQSTDDTDVKREHKLPTSVSEDESRSLESGYSSLHREASLTSRLSSMSLSGYDPTDVNNTYRMDYPRRGHLVVINNRVFDETLKLQERSGTDLDASMIYSTFRSLGFEVSIFHDLKNHEMLRLFIKYAGMNHEDCDCFAVTILSHGAEGLVYGTNEAIEIKKLVEPLKTCKTLVGKPKLFFIQACQGDKLDEGNDVTDAEVYEEDTKKPTLPREADFLYAYSTAPGFFAFRNSTKGSYFMQAISKIFKEDGAKLEVTRLLTRVGRMVAVEFESRARDAAYSSKKQMPCFMSTLTKDLYFPPKM